MTAACADHPAKRRERRRAGGPREQKNAHRRRRRVCEHGERVNKNRARRHVLAAFDHLRALLSAIVYTPRFLFAAAIFAYCRSPLLLVLHLSVASPPSSSSSLALVGAGRRRHVVDASFAQLQRRARACGRSPAHPPLIIAGRQSSGSGGVWFPYSRFSGRTKMRAARSLARPPASFRRARRRFRAPFFLLSA